MHLHGDSSLRQLLPLRIRCPLGLPSLMSTTTVLAPRADMTLSGLAIELFFPVDQEMAEAARRVARQLQISR